MGSLFSAEKKKSSGTTPQSSSNNNVKRTDQEVTSKDRAVLDLKNSKDRLKKFKKKLEVESEKLTDQAKQHIRDKRRDRALLLLKLKKMKENEVENIDKQLLTVMEMIDNIEWESINIQALKALREGNNALNKLHSEMSYEDVVNLLDETNEAIETENQINQLLAGQLTTEDEEALARELAELMGENIATPESITLNLPDAPTHEIESADTTVAEEEAPPTKRVAIMD